MSLFGPEYTRGVLERSVQSLSSKAVDCGSYVVSKAFSPDLRVVGSREGLILSRSGSADGINYNEMLWVFSTDNPAKNSIYGYSNDMNQLLVESGQELLLNELPVDFILDLSAYARRARLGLMCPTLQLLAGECEINWHS